MQKLVQGIHEFQKEHFRSRKGLFEQLAQGQDPDTLSITCSEYRVNPNLLTKSRPGDLFILRNAGNIIPPLAAGKIHSSGEFRFARKAGSIRWASSTASLIRDAGGTPVGQIGITLDITERKAAEDRLRAREAQLRGILEPPPRDDDCNK